MKGFHHLDQVEQESSSNKKIALLEQAIKEDKNLEEYLRLTFGDLILNVASKTIVNALNIKTKKKYKDIGAKLAGELPIYGSTLKTFSNFKELLKDLDKVRGLEAQKKLKSFFDNCHPMHAKWYARCIMKKLSCGVNISTANKALEKNGLQKISSFELSLCNSINCTNDERMKKDLDKVVSKYNLLYVEPKYDGVRLVLRTTDTFQDIKTEAISRNGKKFGSVPDIIEKFKKIFGDRLIELDGELIAKDFQTLMTQVNRKENLDTEMPREYVVFDILSLDGKDVSCLSFSERRKLLVDIFKEVKGNVFKLVRSKYVQDVNEIIDSFQKAVATGFEGIIIKNDKTYSRSRDNWWKMKPIVTAEMRVIELETAKQGKHAGKISSLVVSDKSGTVISNVGSGLTDNDIDTINSSKDVSYWIGKIVEVRYDSITKPDKDGKRSLRFPRFVCFRFDKDKEDSL